MPKHRILSVFGTRPEAIKLAPLVKEIERDYRFESTVCITSQHREMLQQVLSIFDIKPDYDLDIMRDRQSLSEITASILTRIQPVIADINPRMVLVHGDTATTFAASLAAFYNQVDIGHVEAGLRTGNIKSPWPEEANRILTGSLAKLHFTPTATGRKNLLLENKNPDYIYITGNTVIDALKSVNGQFDSDPELEYKTETHFPFLRKDSDLLLVTSHRRENFGDGVKNICVALKLIAKDLPHLDIVYPVHLNPNIVGPVKESLAGVHNIHLLQPQTYLPFVYLMRRSKIILTDSGGIQEEAPALGKPVLVMRDTTERPEAVEAGTVRLVGVKSVNIYKEVNRLLTDQDYYTTMANAINPYGDGTASKKILEIMAREFEL